MIYLDNIATAQTVRVPKELQSSGDLTLTLHSEMEMKDTVFPVTDTGESGMYYTLEVTFAERMLPGEYIYTLKAGDDMVAQGYAIVRGEPVGFEEVNKEIQFKVYEYKED